MKKGFGFGVALWGFLSCLLVSACSDDDGSASAPGTSVSDATSSGQGSSSATSVLGSVQAPTRYAFESKFKPGESSVSYSGQTMRQVLIEDLKSYAKGLSTKVDAGDFNAAAEGDVVKALDFYYRFKSDTSGDLPIALKTDPASKQKVYKDLGSADLVGKTAGNDASTDYKNWKGGAFAGWKSTTIADHGGGVSTPEQLITALFETLEANVLGRRNGEKRYGVDGNGVPKTDKPLPVHVTASGLDLAELIQKCLVTAVTYSQGTDDYLDDDVDNKGLKSSNAKPDAEGAAYSTLEHAIDEALGYFGAARDYLDYTDDEIAAAGGRDGYKKGSYDTDGDGSIDFKSEYNFAGSANAAKRDRGSHAAAKTNITQETMTAFLEMRAIAGAAAGRELLPDEMARVKELRDQAVLAWEKAFSATVLHYINEVLQIMAKFGTADYKFEDHAKAYSELKGFALGLQFNPRKKLSDAQFTRLHELLEDAPVLPGAAADRIASYRQGLIEGRGLLQSAYGFAEANMGDANGKGGW
ncbi:MAG: DUF4856 domain-containing protein [Nitrospirae bacterium]|nr:DUF4856 domain-containing protein [Nitrospirota bacterium]